MGFSYYRSLTVTSNAALLPSTQSNFAVLVSFTHATLKSVGNGGHVQSATGYDIRPFSDSGLTTALTFQLEKYDPATGEVLLWVKIPSLTTGLVFYLAYGNAALITDGSSDLTWDSNYVGVFHCNDASFVTAVNSANTCIAPCNAGQDAAGAGSPIPASGAGLIGLGMDCGTTGYLNAGSSASAPDGYPYAADNALAITYQAWVKGTSFPHAEQAVIARFANLPFGESPNTSINVKSNGKLHCQTRTENIATPSYDGTGSHTLSTDTWYMLTMTWSKADGLVGYVNAEVDATVAGNGFDAFHQSTGSLFIGNNPSDTSLVWNGVMDEIHISNVARSADWIKTEYASQSDPATFLTLGSEATGTPASSGFFALIGV